MCRRCMAFGMVAGANIVAAVIKDDELYPATIVQSLDYNYTFIISILSLRSESQYALTTLRITHSEHAHRVAWRDARHVLWCDQYILFLI